VLCIGTLASRFWPLGLLPSHQSDWFLQFRATACIRFTPYAGRRPHSHQAPRGLVPGGLYAPGFDDTWFLNDASSKGSLSFVSRMLTCTSFFSRFYSNAHHHGLLPQQLGSVCDLLLKADPEGPSLIYCAACDPHGYLVHVELLNRVLLQHTKT